MSAQNVNRHASSIMPICKVDSKLVTVAVFGYELSLSPYVYFELLT